MGFAGMMKDLIDDDYNGLHTGWSSIQPEIKYSKKGKEIVANICRNKKINSKNIQYWSCSLEEKIDLKQGRLLSAWKKINENRLNELLLLKNRLKNNFVIMPIDVSLKELENANDNISKLLVTKFDTILNGDDLIESDENYLKNFCQELLIILLERVKDISFLKDIVDIVSDLKYLVAVILNSKDENLEYRCSERQYINYLIKIGNKIDYNECIDCQEEIVFIEYKYCLVCGKRRYN